MFWKRFQWILVILIIGLALALLVSVYVARTSVNYSSQQPDQPTAIVGELFPKPPVTPTPLPPACTLHVSYVSDEEVLWTMDFDLIPVRYSEEQYYWGVSDATYGNYVSYLPYEPHMDTLTGNLKKFGYSDVITTPYVDPVFYDDSNGHIAHAETGISNYESEAQMQCPPDGFTYKSNVRYLLKDGWELSGKAVSGGDSIWLSDGASSVQLTLPPNLALLADPYYFLSPDSPDVKFWKEVDPSLMPMLPNINGSFKIVWGSPMAVRINRILQDLSAKVYYQTVSDGSVQGVFEQLLLDK